MSLIRIESDITNRLNQLFMDEKNYIITDTNVKKLLNLPPKMKAKIFVIEAGEKSKNIRTVGMIATDLYENGFDKATTIVAIGGGVVGDIAGFVSGIYMRGIKWINVPTTLLSQADSSVGGKTGIDFAGSKNLLGLFNQPSEILISLHFLSTLDESSVISGIGEIVKTSFLDCSLYETVQSEFERIKACDTEILRSVIERCLAIKKKITDSDLLEKGARKALNVGHTIGHALEADDKFKRSHGEYVLWGMKYELMICKEHIECSHLLKMQTMVSRALLGKKPLRFDASRVLELCTMDKKNYGGLISVMIPQKLGLIREIRFKPKHFYKELKKCLEDI